MGENKRKKMLEQFPVGAVATCVGACTLSNAYVSLGFVLVRHITIVISALVWLASILKIILYSKTVREEYGNVVPCSLYASVPMLTMVLGQYVAMFHYPLGKFMWSTAVMVHMIHIFIFTYRNIIRNRKLDTFVPSWFVTYNGFLTAVVTGIDMNEPILCKMIVIYGLIIFLIMMPLMTIRIMKYPISDNYLHTKAVMLSPPSLCLVGYLGFIDKIALPIVLILYVSLLGTILYIFYNIPKFFSVKFYPGFSGLTFPMAIGVIASGNMSVYLKEIDMVFLSEAVQEIQGLQLFVTTGIIAFVGFNFLNVLFKNLRNIKE